MHLIGLHLLPLLSLLNLVQAEATQKFLYQTEDRVTVEPNTTLSMLLDLSTASDEYIGESVLQASFDISRAESTTIDYNILYFRYEYAEGQKCYKDWLLTGVLPAEAPCS